MRSYRLEGSLKIFTGPMFSGKTEALISMANRELIAGRKVQYFVPAIDTRHGVGNVVTNAGKPISSIGVIPEVVNSPEEMKSLIRPDTDLICGDEAQFFGPSIVAVAKRLLWERRRMAFAGLNLTADGVPFNEMPNLMALSTTDIGFCFAVCTAPLAGGGVCGRIATRTTSIKPISHKIAIGGAESYAARCLECFNS